MTAKPQSKKKTAEIIRRCQRRTALLEQRKDYTMSDIAQRHAIVSSTVNRLTKGWQSRTLSDYAMDSVRADYQAGLDLDALIDKDRPSQIGADLKISPRTVQNIWAKYKLKNKVQSSEIIAGRFHWIYTKPISSSPGPAQPYY